MERKKGQRYFTIYGTLNIIRDIDFLKELDTQRYEAGNYFLNREDAELMANSIRILLKTFHKNKSNGKEERNGIL